MEQQKSLYVLFSATPYRMGKCIRFITGEPYNHVSIATEEDLRECYGFARRYYETPFYGGFVTERPSRYIHNGRVSKIRLYRLPLTNAQWLKLDTLLQSMRSQPERYLYNHLSAMMAPMHLKVKVRDAFTCAEFVVSVLNRLGFDFDATRFYTIGGIAGRQSGLVTGCTNWGTALGRKDVGGIVGQMEPYIELDSGAGSIGKMEQDLNTLHDQYYHRPES